MVQYSVCSVSGVLSVCCVSGVLSVCSVSGVPSVCSLSRWVSDHSCLPHRLFNIIRSVQFRSVLLLVRRWYTLLLGFWELRCRKLMAQVGYQHVGLVELYLDQTLN